MLLRLVGLLSAACAFSTAWAGNTIPLEKCVPDRSFHAESMRVVEDSFFSGHAAGMVMEKNKEVVTPVKDKFGRVLGHELTVVVDKQSLNDGDPECGTWWETEVTMHCSSIENLANSEQCISYCRRWSWGHDCR